MTLRELGIINAESREDGVRQAQDIMKTLQGTVRMNTQKALVIGGGIALAMTLGVMRGHWLTALILVIVGTFGIVAITGEKMEFDGSTGAFCYTNGRKKRQFRLTDITNVEEFTKTHHRRHRGHRIPSYYEDKIRIYLSEEHITFPLRKYRLMKDETSFNSGYTDIETLYRLLMLYQYCRSHPLAETTVPQFETGTHSGGQTGLPQSPAALSAGSAASRESDPTVCDLPEDGGMPEL